MIEILISILIGIAGIIVTTCVMSCVIIAGESDKRFNNIN